MPPTHRYYLSHSAPLSVFRGPLPSLPLVPLPPAAATICGAGDEVLTSQLVKQAHIESSRLKRRRRLLDTGALGRKEAGRAGGGALSALSLPLSLPAPLRSPIPAAEEESAGSC